MDRRKFIAGLGSLTAAGAAGIGTGAFTSVEADRQVDVQVASDANAYLGLDDSGDANDAYFDDSGTGEYAVNFAGSGNGGTGVNPNADTIAKSVFTIENQGTQEVTVSLSSGSGNITATEGVSGSLSAPSSDGIVASLDKEATDADLSPGDSIDVGFAINSGTSDLSGTLTINADAT